MSTEDMSAMYEALKRVMKAGYDWITRDSEGMITAFEQEPQYEDHEWYADGGMAYGRNVDALEPLFAQFNLETGKICLGNITHAPHIIALDIAR